MKDRFKTILKDDPKREYFEKEGAEFASGFFAGASVDGFDPIDLYNCLHREPTAVEYFYKADEELKYSWIKKDSHDAVKALDELIGFLVEMVMEDYPHSHTEVCTEFKDRQADWGDMKLILEAMRNPDRTLAVADDHFYFNHQDITSAMHNLAEDYLKQEFGRLGYNYGKTLLGAVSHGDEGLFLQ